MARAPRGARPPAPGHPPARLCAEEPEAGVQARGVRAVRRDARRDQAGSHAHRDERADPVAGAAGRGGRADRGARRSSRERRIPARRLRGRRCAGRERHRSRGGHGDGRHGRQRDDAQRPRRRNAEGRPQRSVPVRQRQEVQAMSREAVMIGGGARYACRVVRSFESVM
ncbi:hypothetical protein BCEN4_820027 [Burkholderia cenocepacia]|nr:hypothetical protein BCEN4_820027 [Burkholderia cenocepacia]